MSRSQSAEERFDARIRKDGGTDCWQWIGTMGSSGYGQLRVHARITGAHRFSFERYIGPIPSGMLVCHRCDTPSCVNPEHLFLGTQVDNMADMAAKGRNNQPNGERHAKTTLTTSDVLAIRKMAPVKRQADLARQFGTNPSTIHNITHGRTWKHLPISQPRVACAILEE